MMFPSNIILIKEGGQIGPASSGQPKKTTDLRNRSIFHAALRFVFCRSFNNYCNT